MSKRALKVLGAHQWHHKIMLILSPVYVNATLIVLVSDAISYIWPKHHKTALHVIGHYTLLCGLARYLVQNVEENLVLRHNLYTLVALDEGYLTALLDRLVLLPLSRAIVPFFQIK